jgi:hypothetical protein
MRARNSTRVRHVPGWRNIFRARIGRLHGWRGYLGGFQIAVLGDPGGPVPNWTLALGPETGDGILDFVFTTLAPRDDFQMDFSASPGVTSLQLGVSPGVRVDETICFVLPTPCAHDVLSASNGQIVSASLADSPGDFVYMGVAGGSGFYNAVLTSELPAGMLVGTGLFLMFVITRKKVWRRS